MGEFILLSASSPLPVSRLVLDAALLRRTYGLYEELANVNKKFLTRHPEEAVLLRREFLIFFTSFVWEIRRELTFIEFLVCPFPAR